MDFFIQMLVGAGVVFVIFAFMTITTNRKNKRGRRK
ncbi:hypothetical protein QE450_002125 [Paenibacillus sp. SORGH_AS306]|nr:hypothetical protein [Paenibacillus sp. SORGH_AS_0306]MDR6111672.1 hypothetical protein [Paenibacillus sp. SORGH_AS_0338]